MNKMQREGGEEMALGANPRYLFIYSINVFVFARSNEKKKDKKGRNDDIICGKIANYVMNH